MAASTVGYIDTTGNRDYLGMIAGQIGRRLKEASDMASDERGYAEEKAGDGGTSLSEAGIGRGYFFKRALGSRFGGDRIARTKGRLGVGGAGTNPTGDFKSRFRGGFDYNVTNELSSIPLSNALTAGLRGVESGLVAISQSLNALSSGMGDLARSQEDAAKQAILNGAFMQAFLNHMEREGARQRARSEEKGLERRSLEGGSGGSGRGMINVTPPSGGGGSGLLGDISKRIASVGTNRSTQRAGTTAVKTLKAGGMLRNTSKTAKIADKVLAPSKFSIKGASAMAMMEPTGAVGNLLKASDKVTGAKIFTKMPNAALAVRQIGKKFQNLGGGTTTLVKVTEEVLDNADTASTVITGARSGSKSKRFVSGVSRFAGADPRNIVKITGDANLMNATKVADAVDNGQATAKTVAAAADAGASPNMLKRFIFGTKPKGLVRGSALTRMLVKNPAGKMFLKKLPLIGAVAGTIFAAQRLMEGDFLGAGLELGSGLLGAVGASPLSLGLDGFLLARDFGAVPFFNGGITSRPTLGMMSEKGQKEGVFPLQGAEGRKTFKMFGEGALNARLDNESEDSKLQAMGHKTYYETMGGWTKFGEGLLSAFGGMKDTVADVFSDLNPFKGLKGREKKSNEGKNQWWDIMDVFPNPQVSNPSNSNELANLLNSSSAQTSMGGLFVSPTIINNYSTVAAGGDGGGSEEVGNGAFPYTFTAFNVDYSLASK